jgi:hypothetical protein
LLNIACCFETPVVQALSGKDSEEKKTWVWVLGDQVIGISGDRMFLWINLNNDTEKESQQKRPVPDYPIARYPDIPITIFPLYLSPIFQIQ